MNAAGCFRASRPVAVTVVSLAWVALFMSLSSRTALLGPGLDPLLFLHALGLDLGLRRRGDRADLGRRDRLDRQATLAGQDLDLGARRIRSGDAVDGVGVSLDLIHFEVLIRAASAASKSMKLRATLRGVICAVGIGRLRRHRHLRDAGGAGGRRRLPVARSKGLRSRGAVPGEQSRQAGAQCCNSRAHWRRGS